MPNFSLYPGEEQELIDNPPSGALTVVHAEQPRVRIVPSQQFPDFLAPEQFFQSRDMQESISFGAERFAYTRSETAVAQISVDEDLSLSYQCTTISHNRKSSPGISAKFSAFPLLSHLRSTPDLTSVLVQRLRGHAINNR